MISNNPTSPTNNLANISTSKNPDNNPHNNNNNNNNNNLNNTTNASNGTGSSNNTSKNRNIIASHYQIAQKIGEGSFGIIFKGYDLIRSNQPVAIKFESRKSDAPQLKDEFRAYKILNSAVNHYYKDPERESHKYLSVQGIPKVYFFGQEGYYNILIIQLLGPSLEDLFEWCGRKFSVSTVARLAIQMIERIQFLHENNLIYRDIKPDNFLIGATTSDNTIYMVDYGMVKQYRDPITHVHIPYRERKSLSGTARYMSINTHLGREQSRRDDLESLGNVFVYFLKGQLPWQGLKAPTNKLKYEKIGDRKQKIPISELCSGLPIQVAEYIRQVRNLKFEENPDYIGYINLFRSILEDLDIHNNNPLPHSNSFTLSSSIKTNKSQLQSKPLLLQKLSNNSEADSIINDLDIYEYDWMRLNDGQGWSWGKNKKINLNGYGSGVRHTTTQQTNVSHSQSQSPQQQHQQHQQQHPQNMTKANSNGHFYVNNGSNNAGNQRVSSKTRAVSVSAANERTGLLGNLENNQRRASGYIQQHVDDTNFYNGNIHRHNDNNDNNNLQKSWLSWICCCYF
jgi:casein kinase 1